MPITFPTPRRFAPLLITLPLMVLTLGACNDVQRQSASVTFASSVSASSISASPISASPAAANPVSARPVSARGNAPGSAQPSGTGKKLMEYGWDMPTASFLQEHQARLGSSPFDGLTLKLSAGQEVFRRNGFSASAVRQDIAALRAIRSPKLRDSYLSLLSGSGPGWDWFSDADWAVTQENVRLMAGAARAGGLRGITFDMEPYTLNPWDYASQPGAASHTFAAAQAKVRERGAAFIRTAQTAFPGIQIYALYLLTANSSDVGTDNSQLQSKQLQSNLQGSDSGLWPSFVNGMLEAAAPGTTLVEGNEHAYDYLRAEQFSAARAAVQRTLLPLVAPENRSRYQQVQLGQGIFADGVMNLWKSPRFCGYYFRSDADRAQVLQHNVYHSMRTADETAWFYNENMDWWGSGAAGQHVPASIVSAVREGRRRAQAGEPLGQNLSAFVPAAEAACNAKVTIGGDLLSGQGSESTHFEVNGVLQGLNNIPDPNCGTWNAGRRYGCTFPGGWSGTLRPVAAGVKFDPPIRTYQNQMKDDWTAHFVAKP